VRIFRIMVGRECGRCRAETTGNLLDQVYANSILSSDSLSGEGGYM
jgi:hypothetical protein